MLECYYAGKQQGINPPGLLASQPSSQIMKKFFHVQMKHHRLVIISD
jgi:hypothetical protein